MNEPKPKLYWVFHRTWYRWKGGRLVPGAGRKTTIAKRVTLEVARDMCRVWNINNPPKATSRKAEFQEM